MKKQLNFLVVTLVSMMVYGEVVPAETPIEVDRATRADWKGSKLARDATEEEIADYYADQEGDAELADLTERVAAQRESSARLDSDIGEQIEEIKKLNAEIAELKGTRDGLQAETKQLGEEVAKLEKAKVAAAKPVPQAKPAK